MEFTIQTRVAFSYQTSLNGVRDIFQNNSLVGRPERASYLANKAEDLFRPILRWMVIGCNPQSLLDERDLNLNEVAQAISGVTGRSNIQIMPLPVRFRKRLVTSGDSLASAMQKRYYARIKAARPWVDPRIALWSVFGARLRCLNDETVFQNIWTIAYYYTTFSLSGRNDEADEIERVFKILPKTVPSLFGDDRDGVFFTLTR